MVNESLRVGQADGLAGWRLPALGGWFAVFLLAVLLNAGGYRYGASDQAFYVPAVLHHLDASLFPRDWTLLGPQDRFNAFTAAAAAGIRATGVTMPQAFLAFYLAGIALLFLASWRLGSTLYRSRWTMVGLAAALTLRHAVALGAVNTLEGYMHPRMIAFALGALALASFLRRRYPAMVLLLGAGFLVHPTTSIWFAAWLGLALIVTEHRARVPGLVLAAVAAGAAAWLLLAGPLAGRLARMDAAWLSVLGPKTYLFPTEWPVSGWIPAILTPAAAAWLFALRQRQGLTGGRERGVAAGAAGLVAVFLASIPLCAARIAFVVQLQVPRVLWMVDLLAVVYIVWYVCEGAPWARRANAARTAALVLLALSLGRGGYVMFGQHRERPLVQAALPANDWNDAMRWIGGNTRKDAWVLASPGHAWKYGTSVRVAAHRDVFLEEAKDTAMSMYSRNAALVVLDRIRQAGGIDDLDAAGLRSLAASTGLDVLVTERDLALPVLYRNARFRVYALR